MTGEEKIQRVLDKWVLLVLVSGDTSRCGGGEDDSDGEVTGGHIGWGLGVEVICGLRKQEWEAKRNHCIRYAATVSVSL